MLRLPDHWLWDFWLVADGDDVHVFYLQAPRSLGDPALRHRNATVGHAVSTDLRDWTVLPDALQRGPDGAFDDIATWTGSVVRHAGTWHMLYTGISTRDDGDAQRVGLATSDDLVTWERHGECSTADPAHYETLAGGARHEAWRDPWVAHDPERDVYDMVVCARANDGPDDTRGVIGHATSTDLREWTTRTPLPTPRAWYQLEVPQLLRVGGADRMLFCNIAGHQRDTGVTGTHYLTSTQGPLGPYALDVPDYLATDGYAGRAIHHRGTWHFLHWLGAADDDTRFEGTLSDPRELRVRDDGTLTLGPAT